MNYFEFAVGASCAKAAPNDATDKSIMKKNFFMLFVLNGCLIKSLFM
jgi:hypothetical protein